MLEARAQLKEGGRIIIPAKMREKLRLSIGEDLLLKVDGDEIRLLSSGAALKRAQDLIHTYNIKSSKLTEVLHEMRNEEDA